MRVLFVIERQDPDNCETVNNNKNSNNNNNNNNNTNNNEESRYFIPFCGSFKIERSAIPIALGLPCKTISLNDR